MLVLGIESSCDDTAASVVSDGRSILSSVVASQIDFHSKYGGVVPEIASRRHIEVIAPVIAQALRDSNVKLSDIDGISVTRGPGLIGSLLVGLSVAKAIAFAGKIPYVGVNHIEGHIAAISLCDDCPAFPFIALVVSGGHTSIYLVNNYGDCEVLGQTKDDAAGEAFDKAAKLMGIGYPGGYIIDSLAKDGNRNLIAFPRAMKDSLDFSFSGLKTSLVTMIKKYGRPFSKEDLPDIAASYQEAIIDVLVDKTFKAAQNTGVSSVVICGGVASNSRLREKSYEMARDKGMKVFIPPTAYCTDNAAMIAALGYHFLKTGRSDPLNLNAVSRWPIGGKTKS